MATHLAHRLPWTSLGDLLKKRAAAPSGPRGRGPKLQPEDKQKLSHFARCLRAALLEFKASDKSTDEEKHEFDLYEWGISSWSAGAMMGYYQSLVSGYCGLNLILSDPEVFGPLLLQRETRFGVDFLWTMAVLCCKADDGHPDWLANHLRPAFTNGTAFTNGRPKPLTAEVLQILRDHCALLFRCMYSISGGRVSLGSYINEGNALLATDLYSILQHNVVPYSLEDDD